MVVATSNDKVAIGGMRLCDGNEPQWGNNNGVSIGNPQQDDHSAIGQHGDKTTSFILFFIHL